MLDIRPRLPIMVSGYDTAPASDADVIIAALEHNDRVHRIKHHDVECYLLQKVLEAMQKPFPALADLALEADWSYLIHSRMDLHRVCDHSS